MTDKLVERLQSAMLQAQNIYVSMSDMRSWNALTDAVDDVIKALTLPQTDLEQRAREMLAAELLESFGYADLTALAATNPITCPATPTKAALRAITKALASSSVPEQDSWKPIETAPKDGTEILGWRDDAGALLVRWTSMAELFTDSELADVDEETRHKEHWFLADFVQGAILADDEAPTAWQPLPPPPEAPQDRGASQEDGRP